MCCHTHLRMGLQGALERDVTRRATHKPDKVIVLFGRRSVDHDVADELAVHLGGGVKAKGNGDVRVFQVAVDGLGHPHACRRDLVLQKVVGNDSSIGVAVVAADDDKAVQVELAGSGDRGGEVCISLDLVTTAANHVKAALVAVDILCDTHSHD